MGSYVIDLIVASKEAGYIDLHKVNWFLVTSCFFRFTLIGKWIDTCVEEAEDGQKSKTTHVIVSDVMDSFTFIMFRKVPF
jgi:hypothetical protein